MLFPFLTRRSRRCHLVPTTLLLVALIPMGGDRSLAESSATLSSEPVTNNEAITMVSLNFCGVEVGSFVKAISDLTGRRFVIADSIKGRITIMAPLVPVGEVYPLLIKALESAGCAVVEDRGINRIVAIPARKVPSAPVTGGDGPIIGDGLVTRVIRLQHVRAAEIGKALDVLAGWEKGGTAILDTSNFIIITDTAASVRRFELIIAEVDRAGCSTQSEVVTLKHADASEIVQQYSAAFGSRDRPISKDATLAQTGSGLVMLAAPQSNRIGLIGPAGELAAMRRTLEAMDVAAPAGRGLPNVLFLSHVSAEELGKSLNAMFDRTQGKEAPKTGDRKRLTIEPNAANNALLVDGLPTDVQFVRDLVGELDRPQKQVLIEVVIAEVSGGDSLATSAEIGVLNSPSKVGSSVPLGLSTLNDSGSQAANTIQNGTFPAGITVGVAQGTRIDSDGNVVASYPAYLNVSAIQKNSKVKILASMPVVSQDNREATVNVVNNIPIQKSTIQGGGGTSRDVIQNVDRIDVGIKLKLTTHVNPSNEVCMMLNISIEAVTDQGPSPAQFAPTISKREAVSTLSVPNGRSIVISGLMREDKTSVVRKIPILGDIPLIGFLFRNSADNVERTNLLIVVTPHVMPHGDVPAISVPHCVMAQEASPR